MIGSFGQWLALAARFVSGSVCSALCVLASGFLLLSAGASLLPSLAACFGRLCSGRLFWVLRSFWLLFVR